MNEELKAEFKATIDEAIKKNLAEIVGKEVSDKVQGIVSKMRLDRAFTGRDASGLDDETKAQFAKDIRSIARGEKAAYLENSDQTGGYLVPKDVYAGIIRIAATTGLIARDARRWEMNSDELEIPRYTGAVMQGDYLGEDSEANETQNDLGVARLYAKTWVAIFRIGNTLLADANTSMADWLMAMAAEGLAYRLDREGFQGGTFAGSPFVGLLESGDVTVQTMATGNTGFDKVSLPEASDAIAALPTAALGGAAFYFHRSVWGKLRARSTNGVFEYGQSNLASYKKDDGIQPSGEILGYPVYTTDVLPAFASSGVSTKFGVFGNLNLALAWGDRGPMEIAKSTDATVGGKSLFRANQTAFRFTHRHAISIALPAAAVVLKTAAS
jgi:HK97 family phage major capsid protein